MNNKALTLSLVMAVLAVFFVESYVSSIEEKADKKYGTQVLVVTAKEDIKEMATINETHLELKLIPKKFLEPVAISYEKKDKDNKEVIRDMKELSGAIALVPIKKGEQITLNKITEPGMRTGLAPQVTPGKRAIAIPVNEITGVSKLVKPGDRVDMIAVFSADGGGEKNSKIAKTVMQDVVVLAVGRFVTNNVGRLEEKDSFGKKSRIRALSEFDGFASVTIEVNPEQAQLIALLLAGENSLTLALRNNDDSEREEIMNATTAYDVFGRDIMKLRSQTNSLSPRMPASKR